MKASAGSGKTFNLAKEYIRMLLSSDSYEQFRHILAVTFTNKATDEMKSRILSELFTLSENPSGSDYLKDFVPSLFPDARSLAKAARGHLTAILHDYSAFAISTIDRFFQQTLRAFSREIGQFSSYQVALDKNALVEEAVARILDSLSEKDEKLISWLGEYVKEDLAEGLKFDLDRHLASIAKKLKSQEFFEAVSRTGIDEDKAYSKENLDRIRKVTGDLIRNFENDVRSSAGALAEVFTSRGIALEDTTRGFALKLNQWTGLKAGDLIKPPSAAFSRKIADPAECFKKSDVPKYAPLLEGSLQPAAEHFLSLFGRRMTEYLTARLIRSQLYGLGIAGELKKEFTLLQQDKNVICLEDSTKILRDIIDGSDAPFIYEKMGVRFEHFLLDEFQDTSDVQWNNFLPLVRNSVSEGFSNLVVGDVKQSIYRWRGSDWHLLSDRIQAEFGIPDKEVEDLKGNWRTLSEIVYFNNGFFSFAAGKLDELLRDRYGLEGGISSIYSGVGQEVCSKDKAPGFVDVAFTDKDLQGEELLQTIRDFIASGGRPGDIAILVRLNDKAAEVAELLVGEGIPVISGDSLKVSSSVTVRRLLSLLTLAGQSYTGSAGSVASYVAKESGLEIPDGYNSLPELSEILLRSLRDSDPVHFADEIPYILAFQDYLIEWAAQNGSDLDLFLKEWENKQKDLCIAPPEGSDSVRVMTVHKSKGLEFPMVIVPYAEDIVLSRSQGSLWCVPDARGTKLESVADTAYSVNRSSILAQTLFSKDYLEDTAMQYVDNINVLYVALTRPKKGLKIIATPSASGKIDNMADLLREYVEKEESGFTPCGSVWRKGEPYDFHSVSRTAGQDRMELSDYPSFAPGKRMRSRSDATDYFSPEGETGYAASSRLRGKVLHDILSGVRTREDIPAAVGKACLSGNLPMDQKDAVLSLLLSKTAGRPEWFSVPEESVLNEVSLFDGRGGVRRPDRVVVTGDSVYVIDYKFGQKEAKYQKQVRDYMWLFRKMGYKGIKGYLWYVLEEDGESVEEVSFL